MMLSLLASFVSIVLLAQAGNRITIGTIDTVQSVILAEKRKILVYVPSSRSSPGTSPQKYPVLYLLDGDANFNAVVGMVQYLGQVNGNTACPEMIVVGISNTNRNRDLTPTKTGADPMLWNLPSSIYSVAGGGSAFMSFIEKELIPYIDAKYPAQPYKLLMGHSFGGLTVINTLVNNTKLFNAYIAVDPSMWWDNLNFLKDVKTHIAGSDFAGRSLFVGIAHSMNERFTIKSARRDTSLDTRHVRAILGVDSLIKNKHPRGLKYASRYYDNDTHGTVSFNATYDALRFIFADYQLKVHNKDMTDSSSAFVDKFRLRYQKISKLFGYVVKPAEAEVNRFAYTFLRMNLFEKAERFFVMNVENYPGSFNVYDSYGDFFVARGNKPAAIAQFRKALSLAENADTRKKLDKLLE